MTLLELDQTEVETIPPVDEFSIREEVPQVACCDKCSAPSEGYAVCRVCGYYAKLGEYVDIDHAMEGFDVEEEVEPFRMPAWSAITIACCLALIAEASVLAWLLPMNTLERFCCSLLHLLVGVCLVLAVQTRSTILTLMNDPNVTFLDCIAWPPKAWNEVFKGLPKTHGLVTMFASGVVCILLSLCVLRALPWHLVFGGEPPPPIKKPDNSMLMQAVLAQAANNRNTLPEMSMEEALAELSKQGDFDLDNLEGFDDETIAAIQSLEDLDTLPVEARCIVIGYLENQSESGVKSISQLVLATANRNPESSDKWRVIGPVSVTDFELAQRLYEPLTKSQRNEPFIHSNLHATWIEPGVKCEVRFRELGKAKIPYKIELLKVYE